jgi:ubiquinol-cytochrome c reductase cytochrome b subunit
LLKIAVTFHMSVNTITWTVRIALFVVPVVLFLVTKRIALGLQRRDRDKVLHGRETGIVKRLPHGEYVEVHQPLDPYELHALTAHEQYRPLDPGRRDADGYASGKARRLRARLSRGFYGEGTQVLKPTVQEYREVTGEHHATSKKDQ